MTEAQGTSVPAGIGRRDGERMRIDAATPIEVQLDALVTSWDPGYRARIAAIRAELEREPAARLEATLAAEIAADPRRRDAIAPPQWRTSLRILGFLAAATTIAGVVAALGFSRRSQLPLDASVAVVITGIAAAIALACLGASLARPSRMGTPNRTVAGALWIAVVGTLGTAAALPLRADTWDATTPTWWWIVALEGAALLVLAVGVSIARVRAPAAARDEEHVRGLRLRFLAEALDRAVRETEAAWLALDPRTRADLERERTGAIDALQVRCRGRLDERWLRACAPGVHALAFLADRVHATMHLGDAQLVDRSVPGPHGWFFAKHREARAVDAATEAGGSPLSG